MYVCMYVCMYMRVCVYIYIYMWYNTYNYHVLYVYAARLTRAAPNKLRAASGLAESLTELHTHSHNIMTNTMITFMMQQMPNVINM